MGQGGRSSQDLGSIPQAGTNSLSLGLHLDILSTCVILWSKHHTLSNLVI